MKKKLIFNKNIIPILIILALSLSIRFISSINNITFSQDEARDLLIIENHYKNDNHIFFYGPKASVSNFYLPPFYYQLYYLLSYIFNLNPFVMKYLITFIESITPVIIFLILKNFFTIKNSFISSIIYLTSKSVIMYSTSAWNPNMIPFFTTLALYFWINYIIKDNKKSIIWASICTILAFQLHYQATVLFLFYIIVFIWSIFKKREKLKYWILAFIISLLTLSPYFYIEFSNHWQNTKQIISFFTQEHSQYYNRVSKPYYIINFYPIFIEKTLFFRNYYEVIIGRVIFYLGIISLFYFSIKRQKLKYHLLLIYLSTIFIMLRVYKGDKVDYYMSSLYIMTPILIASILTIKNKIFHYLFITFLIFIAYLNGINNIGFKTNQYESLKKSILELNNIVGNKKIRIIFHNDDYINVFAYGMNKFGKFNLDKNAPLIVDICGNNYNCSWDKINWCRNSKAYTYSSLLKSNTNTYLKIKDINSNYPLTIGISRIDIINEPNYQITNREPEYGSDQILNNVIY